jgi:hypothetical protein
MARLSELRRPTTLAELAAAACAAAVVVLLVGVAVSTLQRARTFESQRAERLLPPPEREHAVVGRIADEPVASALRKADALLGRGDRFALVVAPAVDRSTAGAYRLLSDQYLFPALATADPGAAEVVIGVGGAAPAPDLDLVYERAGAWVGRRT